MADHPNEALVRQVGAAVVGGNLAAAAAAMADDVVWHYCNPRLPELAGDHAGADGVAALFSSLAQRTGGTFAIQPMSVGAIGEELVITHVRPKLTLDGEAVETDAVVVWRVRDGRVTEVWDIPAVDDD